MFYNVEMDVTDKYEVSGITSKSQALKAKHPSRTRRKHKEINASSSVGDIKSTMTAKQIKLAELLAGDTGISKVEAYRHVYDWKGKKAYTAASVTARNDKVVMLTDKLREYKSKRDLSDRDGLRKYLMDELLDLIRDSKTEKDKREAIKLAGSTIYVNLYAKPEENAVVSQIQGDIAVAIRSRLLGMLKDQSHTVDITAVATPTLGVPYDPHGLDSELEYNADQLDDDSMDEAGNSELDTPAAKG